MRELGIVKKTERAFASVSVDKKDECSKCGMCMFPKNATAAILYADNSLGAKEGDSVIVEMTSCSKLIGAILAFLVPLILIIISALLTYLVIGEEIYMLFLSVGSIIVWYLILPFIDKRLKKSKKFAPKIVQIINKEE